MARIGALHPLLIHFPIALVIVAAAAETAAMFTANGNWRAMAVANLRFGAAFAVLAAAAGWKFASASALLATPLLGWHAWAGTVGAAAAFVAALASRGGSGRSSVALRVYRLGLFTAGALIGVAGHLGGLLVWGDFLNR